MNIKKTAVLVTALFISSCSLTNDKLEQGKPIKHRGNRFTEGITIPRADDLIDQNVVLSEIMHKPYQDNTVCYSAADCSDTIFKITTRYWRLPYLLKGLDLQATYILKTNKWGVVYSVKLNSSSGNQRFDDLCFKAIIDGIPYPIEYRPNAVESEELNGVRLVFKSPPLFAH